VQVLQYVYEALEEDKRKVLVSALGHLLLDQTSLLRREAYLKKVLEFEINRTAASQVHTLFREETVVSGILYEYARLVSNDHLKSVLKTIAEKLSGSKLKVSKAKQEVV